jgi:hypothetical protein
MVKATITITTRAQRSIDQARGRFWSAVIWWILLERGDHRLGASVDMAERDVAPAAIAADAGAVSRWPAAKSAGSRLTGQDDASAVSPGAWFSGVGLNLTDVGDHQRPHRPACGPGRDRCGAAAARPSIGDCQGQPCGIGQIGQQPGAGVAGEALRISGDGDLPPNRCSLHLRSAVIACTCEAPLAADDQSLNNSDPTAPNGHFLTHTTSVEPQGQTTTAHPG